MTSLSKLKHVRSCIDCNKIADFNSLTDNEILNGKPDLDNEITDLKMINHNLNVKISALSDKIVNIKVRSGQFTEHIMKKYLKYIIHVKDNDKQNENIIFHVDVGNVVVEVPFSEIIAKAIGEYAKGEFQKKLC